MKKCITKYRLVAVFCLVLLAFGFYQNPNLRLTSVEAEVYSTVYTDDVDPTITDDAYDNDSYLNLPVWQDIYFQGVDDRFADPVLPATDIVGYTETARLPVDAGLDSVSISQEYAVFTQGVGVESEVYAIDLDTNLLIQLTHDVYEQGEPSVYGNLAVWQDYRNGNWDIYLYDLDSGKEYQLTNDPGDQTEPAIYQNSIVWQDNRKGDWDIYYCSLTAKVQEALTLSQDYEVNPKIFGSTVTWEHLQDGVWQVEVMNLPNGLPTQVSYTGGHNTNPALGKDYLVWTCFQDNQWSMYKHDLGTGSTEQIAEIPQFPQVPVVYANVCAFRYYQDGSIYTSLLNLKNGSQLTLDQNIKEYALFGQNLIWVAADPDGSQHLSYGKVQFTD